VASAELAAQAVAEGLAVTVSASTVRRWLAQDAIRPWQHRSWIFPRDPGFAAKAAGVLDLYQRPWGGIGLGDDEYVISADEKSQLQAVSRCHPELATGPGRLRRVEFEYDRHGTLAYFGAYDVHRAVLMGRVAPTTGIAPFAELVTQVMTTEPYASARRVFWVVDNGSSHAGKTSVARMRQAWPRATLVHLPVHASWLNQIEIVFSVIGRKIHQAGGLRRPRRPGPAADRLRTPLQRHRHTVRLEVHPLRPGRPAGTPGHSPQRAGTGTRRLRRARWTPWPHHRHRPRPASPNASPSTPTAAGRPWPTSRSASAPSSPTSTGSCPTVTPCPCADCVTPSQPASGASPSTGTIYRASHDDHQDSILRLSRSRAVAMGL